MRKHPHPNFHFFKKNRKNIFFGGEVWRRTQKHQAI
nr:MAG TPA: hypothetical protein [Caudoviricetes sp.]